MDNIIKHKFFLLIITVFIFSISGCNLVSNNPECPNLDGINGTLEHPGGEDGKNGIPACNGGKGGDGGNGVGGGAGGNGRNSQLVLIKNEI